MKVLSLALVASILLLSITGTGKAFAQQFVNGYERSNGTYVKGYYRSQADGTTLNNYSTRGNRNPYTGKQGTVNPYAVRTGYTMSGFRPGINGDSYINSPY